MGKLIAILTPDPPGLAQQSGDSLGHRAAWTLPGAFWFPDSSLAAHCHLHQQITGAAAQAFQPAQLPPRFDLPANKPVKELAPLQQCLLAYSLALAAGREVIIAVAVGANLSLAAQTELAHFLKAQMAQRSQVLLYLAAAVTPVLALADEVWWVQGEQAVIWTSATLPPAVKNMRYIQFEFKSAQAATDLINTWAVWSQPVARPTPQSVVVLVQGEQQLFELMQTAGAQLHHIVTMPTPLAQLPPDLPAATPPHALADLLATLPQSASSARSSPLILLRYFSLHEIWRFLQHGQKGEIDYLLIPIVLQLVGYTTILTRWESLGLPPALTTLGLISGALPLLLSPDAFHRWHWPVAPSLRACLNRTPIGRRGQYAIWSGITLAHSLITALYSWPLLLAWSLDSERTTPGPVFLSWLATTLFSLGLVALLGRWQSRLSLIRLATYVLWLILWIGIIAAPTFFMPADPLSRNIMLGLSGLSLILALRAWA